MSAVSLNWVKRVNDVYATQVVSKAYTYMLEEIRMSIGPTMTLRSTDKSPDSQYESLLKRFQTYAFGARSLDATDVPSYSRSNAVRNDDALLELKHNVNVLSELNDRLGFMMKEISSALPKT